MTALRLEEGCIIRERQHNGTRRVVVALVPNQYALTRGVDSGRVTRIGWQTLRRYEVVQGAGR
jgi:hypothetical protein